jgi:hypothetical protein
MMTDFAFTAEAHWERPTRGLHRMPDGTAEAQMR